ncbi:MAG: hypothetical protein M1823_003180 [Watsoniomyces obsoletus]|nr:MAG: hypothetical protein M1823_003180 [Watsoniomyces obsoletus]
MTPQQCSPFLSAGPVSKVQSLAILHLRRDQLLATKLLDREEVDSGYNEGPVINTRFGSFPHSTLVGLPWGSQVRASKVDTGSRGRRIAKQTQAAQEKKRKREEDSCDEIDSQEDEGGPSSRNSKTPTLATSGFIHLLAPTPELWTASLPHRTQVVYTPDYSYILHRLRARPGSVLIEAGAGSGSFTHAAARAVFNGYPRLDDNGRSPTGKVRQRLGKVWSYEFHKQRVEKIQAEVKEHQLNGIVEVTHRDVYRHGFSPVTSARGTRVSPRADAIFLDLPAPWLALRHLTRMKMAKLSEDGINSSDYQVSTPERTTEAPAPAEADGASELIHDNSETQEFHSPLNPDRPVHVCTFSPCIEQVQRTVSTLRELGWVDIDLVAVNQKRIEVRRERVGLHEAGQRGAHASAATVDEAVEKLRQVEAANKIYLGEAKAEDDNGDRSIMDTLPSQDNDVQQPAGERKIFKEGRIVHRAEPELKTHTSYLVFAVLPQDWTVEDEERARQRWPVSDTVVVNKPSKCKGTSSRKTKTEPIEEDDRIVA